MTEPATEPLLGAHPRSSPPCSAATSLFKFARARSAAQWEHLAALRRCESRSTCFPSHWTSSAAGLSSPFAASVDGRRRAQLQARGRRNIQCCGYYPPPIVSLPSSGAGGVFLRPSIVAFPFSIYFLRLALERLPGCLSKRASRPRPGPQLRPQLRPRPGPPPGPSGPDSGPDCLVRSDQCRLHFVRFKLPARSPRFIADYAGSVPGTLQSTPCA